MIIVITGKPGIGKTTAIKKLLSLLGDKAVGFYTQEIRDKTGKRIGFEIITTNKKKSLLAHKYITTPYKVGNYNVNVKEFEDTAIPVLEKALKEKDKVIVIDEIGKMELFSQKFVDLVNRLLEKNDIKAVVTLPQKDVHQIIKKIKKHPEAIILNISYENRDYIPKKIMELLGER